MLTLNYFTKKASLLCSALLISALITTVAKADEGMWLPLFLKQLNEAAMLKGGMKITADDIYNVNRASIKDAVVQFGGGCTAEIISTQGLLLTNHHCGFGAIQNHSSVANDYLKNGFWAKNPTEELTNSGLTASILVRMEDVTAKVLGNINITSSPADKDKLIKDNIKKIATAATLGNHYEASVKPFYYGTEYYLFVSEVFTDVRLVGAPPQSVGAFGGDTDNWMWPRHTADFSLFRIYAGPDNKPAPVSNNNKPYTPKYHFPISLAGIKQGDFTMVLGYPGRTQEYLSSFGVKTIVEDVNPYKIDLRTKLLHTMDADMRATDSIRIKYASKYAQMANGWKKWQGELKGLQQLDAINRKQAQETYLSTWVKAGGGLSRQRKYGQLIPALKQQYDSLHAIMPGFSFYQELLANLDVYDAYAYFRSVSNAIEAKKVTDKTYTTVATQMLGFWPNYYQPLDAKLTALYLQAYSTSIPEAKQPDALQQFATKVKVDYGGNWLAATTALYQKSQIVNPVSAAKLLAKTQKDNNTKTIDKDPLYILIKGIIDYNTAKVMPLYIHLADNITALNQAYLAALREMEDTKTFYPDANSTFRVAYGKVDGYTPADGVEYHWQTTLEGVMQKDDSTVAEFNVPKKLKQLYAAKDYGQYAVNGTVPVAFTASNHTTGGNSGSPVINAKGQLIGTNFDRCWEGTMSDIMYSPTRCRNISLDVRYTLFIIEKLGNCKYLIDEMTLVKD